VIALVWTLVLAVAPLLGAGAVALVDRR